MNQQEREKFQAYCYQAQDEKRLIESAVKEVAYIVERAIRCASSSYGEQSGEYVRETLRNVYGINYWKD